MTTTSKPRLSVSTWSLHHALGKPTIYGPGAAISAPPEHADLNLLDLPARVAQMGIHTLELCHFHLPSRDESYLADLRAALDEAGIELWSFLIDAGDVTHEQHAARDEAWMSDWLPVAQQLGARCARVIAGQSEPSPQAMQKSQAAMRRLCDQAAQHDIRLMTENWFSLLSSPRTVLELLDALNGDLSLCLDFGNWKGDDKYERLTQIAPRADSCHVQAAFNSQLQPDADDLTRCLNLTRETNFSGPYTLICSGVGNQEWRALEHLKVAVSPFVAAA